MQVRRAGALALARALQDKEGLQLLALNENEIQDAAIDDMKVSARSRVWAHMLLTVDCCRELCIWQQ